jgi:hypothetical protein
MSDKQAQFCLECFETPPVEQSAETREAARAQAEALLRSGRFRHIVIWGPGDGGEWRYEAALSRDDVS